MKKIYSLVGAMALASICAGAQTLPNPGFEGEWVPSTPWTPITGTSLSMDAALDIMGMKPEGGVNQPEGWIISNVLGVISEMEDGGYGALGSTVVGFRTDGFESATAVQLTNNPNPFMSSQIVPAYMSLGTSWATNTLDWTTFAPANKDGGVFGGLTFSNRPDAVTFNYKLEKAENAESVQKATVLAYAWKGTWMQADVPAANSMSTEAPMVEEMIDRDRNILGMETSQGGAVTHTEDAELIMKSLTYIEEEADNWTAFTLPLDYITASTPEKINVIVAANDYFDSETIVSGNTLTVDNIALVYYSRLKSISVNGTEIEGFEPDKYAYILSSEMPAVDAISYEALGTSGCTAVETVADEAAGTITLKVSNTNEGGLDADGEATHEYVLQFGAAQTFGGIVYEGNVIVDLGSPSDPIPANVHIIADPNNSSLCTLALPDFSLGEGATIGDIVVPNVVKTVNTQGDGYDYEGSVEG
ncbi:MAG: calycin-like domain-containing protein, partial [Muribaculaceae bacterium]|nr:calycin-like domain-containing protein [Muribaculaceae bacterium]